MCRILTYNGYDEIEEAEGHDKTDGEAVLELGKEPGIRAADGCPQGALRGLRRRESKQIYRPDIDPEHAGIPEPSAAGGGRIRVLS